LTGILAHRQLLIFSAALNLYGTALFHPLGVLCYERSSSFFYDRQRDAFTMFSISRFFARDIEIAARMVLLPAGERISRAEEKLKRKAFVNCRST